MSVSIEQPGRRSDRRTIDGPSRIPYDLVVVGFGTNALAVAASLADSKIDARILFVEREHQFTWNGDLVLPDHPIGSAFLRDLPTIQISPRSEFTFVNFLHATNQLVRFTNNSQLAPSRRLQGQYLRWVAERLQRREWVRYGHEVVRVWPEVAPSSNRVALWTLELRDPHGTLSSLSATRMLLATGAHPHIPVPLASPPLLERLVLHSSSCASVLKGLRVVASPLHIAIVGADQEAAEIFEYLHTARGKHRATLFFADSALRPTEHTSSVDDLLHPAELASSSSPLEIRQRLQSPSSAQPHPTVDVHTLERLYEAQYTLKVAEPDARQWRFQMRPLSEVVTAEREHDRVRLVTRNPRTGAVTTAAPAFDMVIAATGYESSADMKLLRPITPLLDGGALTVNREYQVNFRRDALARGSRCGMWVLGSLGLAHRRDDFRMAAERGRRAAQSILAALQDPELEKAYGEVAVL